MRYPPYQITDAAARRVAALDSQLAALTASDNPLSVLLSPTLRRENRIRSIHASLAIENNTLSLEQVTAIVDGKPVMGPPRDIQEVRGAIAAYEKLEAWTPHNMADLLEAHALLMHGLLNEPGMFRTGGVGIFKGSHLAHMAPPAHMVAGHMQRLLAWLKTTQEHPLVTSCVFHYEFEFIHPFADGNGRMGRLWQTLILSKWKPLMAYMPVETLVHNRQEAYYASLGQADAEGEATAFIDFMLLALEEALADICRGRQQATDQVSQQLTDQVTDQVSDQVTEQPTEPVYKLLVALGPQEKSAAHLMQALGLRHLPSFRKVYLNPALNAGFIERTQPHSPQSPTQRYRLSARGRGIVRPR